MEFLNLLTEGQPIALQGHGLGERCRIRRSDADIQAALILAQGEPLDNLHGLGLGGADVVQVGPVDVRRRDDQGRTFPGPD